MRSKLFIALLLSLSWLFTSCQKEEPVYYDPVYNFDTAWHLFDQKYCFFEEKRIDWDSVYQVYRPLVYPNMSREVLFYTLNNMLRTLQDGHVNISSPFDVGRYHEWYLDYPANFSAEIVERCYLGKDYRIASGLKYKILDDNIGYIRYESFSDPIGNGNLSYVLQHFQLCRGIIIDIRNNGGGSLTNCQLLGGRFTDKDITYGYMQHKTGKGHHDFSKPIPLVLSPYQGMRWSKKVVVLANRHCFSAANDFVNMMKQTERAVIIGDRTGGGGGFPFSGELPIGWNVRFSTSPTFDSQMRSVESGIDPDITVATKESSYAQGRDDIIEKGREILSGEDLDN